MSPASVPRSSNAVLQRGAPTTASTIFRSRLSTTVDLCSGKALTIDELVSAAARVFGVNGPTIEHKGVVPEYIKFRASPEEMGRLFDFKARVPLEQGLRLLADHLIVQGTEGRA